MEAQVNVAHIFTGSAVAKNEAISAMSNGEIGIRVVGTATLDDLGGALASTESYQIVLKDINGDVKVSDIIDPSVDNYAVVKEAGTAAVQKVDYIGYNGTSGSIDAINSNYYAAKLHMLGETIKDFAQQKIVEGIHVSDSAATQYEVAQGIVETIIKNNIREANQDVKAEKVNSGTSVATTGTGTVTVLKGSKYITAATDIDAVASVGDLIRFGTATTSPVYKIVELDTANDIAKLDVEYQGENGTFLEAAYKFVTTVGDYGIKLTGVARDAKPGVFPYTMPNWTLQLVGFGDTEITNDTAASKGVGTYKAVAELEAEFASNEGGVQLYRGTEPSPQFTINAQSGDAPYDMYVITFKEEIVTSLGSRADCPKQVYLAVKNGGTNQTDLNTALGV